MSLFTLAAAGDLRIDDEAWVVGEQIQIQGGGFHCMAPSNVVTIRDSSEPACEEVELKAVAVSQGQETEYLRIQPLQCTAQEIQNPLWVKVCIPFQQCVVNSDVTLWQESQ